MQITIWLPDSPDRSHIKKCCLSVCQGVCVCTKASRSTRPKKKLRSSSSDRENTPVGSRDDFACQGIFFYDVLFLLKAPSMRVMMGFWGGVRVRKLHTGISKPSQGRRDRFDCGPRNAPFFWGKLPLFSNKNKINNIDRVGGERRVTHTGVTPWRGRKGPRENTVMLIL